MMRVFIIILLAFLAFNRLIGQIQSNPKINFLLSNDTTKSKNISKIIITPSLLFSAAIISNSQKKEIQKHFPIYNTHLDEFTRFAPIGILYGSDLLKIKSKNSMWNQSKYLFLSQLCSSIIVKTLKSTIKSQRPDESDDNSFPSGHVSTAFVNSQVLFNEYFDNNIYLASSGHLFSITTSFFRITNNKHWITDVLVSGGIAILCTNVIYHLKPLKNWNPFKNQQKISLIPYYNQNGFAFNAKWNL